MRIALLLCIVGLAALVGMGCTISIKPIAQKKKVVQSARRHHHRAAIKEAQTTPAPQHGAPLDNFQKPQGHYRLISPTPNPELEPR